MSTIKTFIKRQPLLTYFAPTFALSWGSWLVLLINGKEVFRTTITKAIGPRESISLPYPG